MLKHVNVTDDSASSFTVEVKKTDGHGPIGETVGKRNIAEKRIPVLSCEGGCIVERLRVLRRTWLQKRRASHAAVMANW